MDVALNLYILMGPAEYYGSLTENTKEQYDAVDWQDSRPKPTWLELESVETEAEIFNIKQKLGDLDEIISRTVEDNITKPVYGKDKETIEEKQRLRTELKEKLGQ